MEGVEDAFVLEVVSYPSSPQELLVVAAHLVLAPLFVAQFSALVLDTFAVLVAAPGMFVVLVVVAPGMFVVLVAAAPGKFAALVELVVEVLGRVVLVELAAVVPVLDTFAELEEVVDFLRVEEEVAVL